MREIFRNLFPLINLIIFDLEESSTDLSRKRENGERGEKSKNV